MAIAPLIAAGLIGAGTSAASNIIQNTGNRRSQNRANRHNIAFWNLQNEYNNPSAQIERLKNAGLNPNLIYGTSPTSAVGNAGAIAPSKAAPYKADNPMQAMHQYANVRQSEAQTDNLKTQNTVLAADAALKGVQTANLASDTRVKKQLEATSVNAAQENLRNLEQKTIGAELDNTFKDSSMKDRLKNILYQAQTAKENLKGSKLLNKLRSLEIDLKNLGIERNDPWYFRVLGRNWKSLKNAGGNQMLDAIKQ